MKSIKVVFKLATPLLVLALSACGGGSVSSMSTIADANFSAADMPQAKSLAYAAPLESVNYQDVRNLAGTGKGSTVSPSDIKTHYSITSTYDGSGTTIAIVDAPGSVYGSAITADLNTFSTYYGLPLVTSSNNFFKQIDLSNGAKVTANSSSDWKMEVALDVEWAHAIAPKANIILVTAKSSGMADMMNAVQTAAAQPGVVAISMSWGGNEFSGETGAAYDGVFKTIQAQGIVLLASSGDSGNNGSNQAWPAVSPYVTAVGGTSITTVAYNLPSVTTEVAWNLGGGGASKYEPAQTFQTTNLVGDAALSLSPKFRMVPDVAYNADPNKSPVAIVAGNGWFAIGGTSAGAPQWAGLVAQLAQERVAKKESALAALIKATAGGFNGLIYQTKVDANGVFDVTVGNDDTAPKACAICNAGKGYDAVTGLGVPRMLSIISVF